MTGERTPTTELGAARARPAALPGVLSSWLRICGAELPVVPVQGLIGSVLLRPHLQQMLAVSGPGVLGLELATLGEFGARLAGDHIDASGRVYLGQLADRVLATTVAHGADDYFSEVADAPGFADAARRTTRELRLLGREASQVDAALSEGIASAYKAQAMLGLQSRMAGAREPFWDGVDALAAATPDDFDGAALFLYGITYLPDVAKRLIEGIAERVPVMVFLPKVETGAGEPCEDLVRWLEGLGVEIEDADEGKQPEPVRPRFVSAPDPVSEVREAVRSCLEWAEEGIPFREMAITYRQADPYEAIVETVLREAGLPAYLHRGVSLAERPLGRRVLGLIDVVESVLGPGLGRAEVVALLSDGPLPQATREAVGRVPTGPRADKLTREAGVTSGITAWKARLDEAIARAEARAARPDAPSWAGNDPRDMRRLKDFAVRLDERIRKIPECAPWDQCAHHFMQLVQQLITEDDPDLGFLDAFRQVDVRFGEIDFGEFLRLLRHDIQEGVFRTATGDAGAFRRRGINVLDVNQVSRLGFRAIALVGVGERQFPPPPRQDPLLLDHERAAVNAALGAPAGEGLPLKAFGTDEEPLLFALAQAAASDRLLISYARSDGQKKTGSLPSSFFMKAASGVAGRRLTIRDFQSGLGSAITWIPASRIGAPVAGGTPGEMDPSRSLTLAEWDLTLVEGDGDPARAQLGRAVLDAVAPGIAPRARHLYRNRWSPLINEFTGLTASSEALTALQAGHEDARPFSATRLERYAGCPLRYMLENVVGVKVLEAPEHIIEADKRELGTLIHTVLEKFVAASGPEPPSLATRDGLMTLMHDIAEEEFKRFKDRGLAGAPLLWEVTSRELMGDLFAWLDHEIADPRPAAEHHLEVSFGMEVRRHEGGWIPIDPDSLSVADPLLLDAVDPPARISGMIDRLDDDLLGEGFSVMDYKTGAGKKSKGGSLDKGRALQLPLYLLGGEFLLGKAADHGRAEYVNFSLRNRFSSVVFKGDDLDDRRADLDKALTIIVEGIRGGDFHPEPSDRECRFCDFTTLCDAGRQAQAARKGGDARVQRFRELDGIG
jgi:ATP-dependent helicase/nuclease subunit B